MMAIAPQQEQGHRSSHSVFYKYATAVDQTLVFPVNFDWFIVTHKPVVGDTTLSARRDRQTDHFVRDSTSHD